MESKEPHAFALDFRIVQQLISYTADVAKDAGVRVFARQVAQTRCCPRLTDIVLYLLCFCVPALFLIATRSLMTVAVNNQQMTSFMIGAGATYTFLLVVAFVEPIYILYRRVVTDNLKIMSRYPLNGCLTRLGYRLLYLMWRYRSMQLACWGILTLTLTILEVLTLTNNNVATQPTLVGSGDSLRTMSWFGTAYAAGYLLLGLCLYRVIPKQLSIVYHPYVQQFPHQPSSVISTVATPDDPVRTLVNQGQSILLVRRGLTRDAQLDPILVSNRLQERVEFSWTLYAATTTWALIWILQPWIYVVFPVPDAVFVWSYYLGALTLQLLLLYGCYMLTSVPVPSVDTSANANPVPVLFCFHTGFVVLFAWTSVPMLNFLSPWFTMAYQQHPLESTFDILVTYVAFLVVSQSCYFALSLLLEKMSAPYLYIRFLYPQQTWSYLCQVATFGFTPVSWQLFVLFFINFLHQVMIVTRGYYLLGQQLLKAVAILWSCMTVSATTATAATTGLNPSQSQTQTFQHVLDIIMETQLYVQETIASAQTRIGITLVMVWFREQLPSQATSGFSFTDRFVTGADLWFVLSLQFFYGLILWIFYFYVLRRRMDHSLDLFFTFLTTQPGTTFDATQIELSSASQTRPSQSTIGADVRPIYCTVRLSDHLDILLKERFGLDKDPVRFSLVKQAFEEEYPELFPRQPCESRLLRERMLRWHRWFPTMTLRKHIWYFLATSIIVYVSMFLPHVSCPARFFSYPIQLVSPNMLCGFGSV